jgi:hypothetical protein
MEDVCVGDVSLPLDEVTRALGPVDVLVNAHSISPNRPLIDADESEWDRTFAAKKSPAVPTPAARTCPSRARRPRKAAHRRFAASVVLRRTPQAFQVAAAAATAKALAEPSACTLQSFEQTYAPIGIEDATFGLYSATNASKGVQFEPDVL